MKKRNRARSSSLFLLELIIAILFFSVASAVCVQFFVKSHTMSQQSQAMNFAVGECSSIAEIVQASDNEKEIVSLVKNIYPDVDVNSDGKYTNLNIYIEPAYCINADFTTIDGMIDCNISAEKDNQSIYELEVKHNAKK